MFVLNQHFAKEYTDDQLMNIYFQLKLKQTRCVLNEKRMFDRLLEKFQIIGKYILASIEIVEILKIKTTRSDFGMSRSEVLSSFEKSPFNGDTKFCL